VEHIQIFTGPSTVTAIQVTLQVQERKNCEMHYQAVSRNSSEGAELMFCERQCRRNLLHVSQSINSPRLGIISQLSGKRSRICSSAQSTKPPYKTSTGTSGNCPTSPQAGHFPLIPIFLDVALVKYNLKLVHFHTLHNL